MQTIKDFIRKLKGIGRYEFYIPNVYEMRKSGQKLWGKNNKFFLN